MSSVKVRFGHCLHGVIVSIYSAICFPSGCMQMPRQSYYCGMAESAYATVRSISQEWTDWYVLYDHRVLSVHIGLSLYFDKIFMFSITVLSFSNCYSYLVEWPFTQIVNQHIYISTRWNYVFCYQISQMSSQWVAHMCHFCRKHIHIFSYPYRSSLLSGACIVHSVPLRGQRPFVLCTQRHSYCCFRTRRAKA